jgi:hypothetical protein
VEQVRKKISMELALCQPSGAKNLEVAPRFAKNVCAAALSSVGDCDISWLYCSELSETTKQTLQELQLPSFVHAVLPTLLDAISFSVHIGCVDLSDCRDINRWAQGVTYCQQDPSSLHVTW